MQTIYDASRSWIEVDLAAMRHNVQELMTLLPDQSQLMAVVKADAYGHGAVTVCRMLNQMGIEAFAVATIGEAIELREHHIEGEILILGYTSPKQVHLLKQYHLIQTMIDKNYAQEMNQQKVDIDVHIAVDTGMHRLGNTDIQDILDIYEFSYLHVKGIFSHLCVCDSHKQDDLAFTEQQIKKFHHIIEVLKKKNNDVGKIHLQSSYGLLNYSHLCYDYARVGISLYGVYSSLYDQHNPQIHLQPALALKSKIILLKDVQAEETVGYGRTYHVQKPSQIATVPIGYADGLPRCLSNQGYVLVRGQKVPIVGRLCMDQLMIDVSDVHGVALDDIVTIIGNDGESCITVEEIADLSQTISNEILSRLGHRLPRLYKGDEGQ